MTGGPVQAQRVGGIRPSQMMYSYGVGSTVDLPNFSVVVAGLDDWDETKQTAITEERLLAAVRLDAHVGPQVTQLRGAPWEPETRNPFDSWAFTGLPVVPFPRWLRCSNTACNLLASIDSNLFELEVPPSRPHLARYVHRCNSRGKPPAAIPARFVTACPSGHLDEFPWVEFCHKDQPCTGNPILKAYDVGEGTRSTSMGVECQTCGQKQLLNQAFGQNADRVLPQCRGRMPHLRTFNPGGCANQASALLLGASNAWFPVTRSVLSIPAAGDPLGQAISENLDKLARVDSADTLAMLMDLAPQDFGFLTGFQPADAWQRLEELRNGTGATPNDLDLLGPEWTQFTHPDVAPAGPDFRLRAVRSPTGFDAVVAPTVLAERLREVVALTGFTRLDGPDSGVASDAAPTHTVPLARRPTTWLPAAETRGEGVFIRLPEDAVADWEARVAGTERMDALHRSQQRWRQRRNLDPAGGWNGERYVLLHSLSHALINEFALECGYAAASIRERIYSRQPGGTGEAMAGILLYTSAPDTEGTLGGLVALGDDQILGRLLTSALTRAQLCSTDPMCADHLPDEDDESLHGASCHACLFVPETSCELGNRYLDRAVLVPTLAGAGIEYFTGLP